MSNIVSCDRQVCLNCAQIHRKQSVTYKYINLSIIASLSHNLHNEITEQKSLTFSPFSHQTQNIDLLKMFFVLSEFIISIILQLIVQGVVQCIYVNNAYHTGNLFSLTSSCPQSYFQQCQASSVTDSAQAFGFKQQNLNQESDQEQPTCLSCH